jgi:hypothetical protein
MTTWINPKTAAEMAGIGRRQFLDEWIPEDGIAQVHFRNLNGKRGRGRRPEVDLEDLENVLTERDTPRAS